MCRFHHEFLIINILMFASMSVSAVGMSVKSQGTATYTARPLLAPQTQTVSFSMLGISGNPSTLDSVSNTVPLTASGGSGSGNFQYSSPCPIDSSNTLQIPAGTTSCVVTVIKLGNAQFADSAPTQLTVNLKPPAVCAIKYPDAPGESWNTPSNPGRDMNAICNQLALSSAASGQLTQMGNFTIPSRLYTDSRDGWFARDKCSYTGSASTPMGEVGNTNWNNTSPPQVSCSNGSSYYISSSFQNRRKTTFVCQYQQAACPSEVNGILIEKLN
jgi:hypothetical protein